MLEQIINMKHELVQLAGKLDRRWLDGEIAPLYSNRGCPPIETRFVLGLLLLKYIYALSGEGRDMSAGAMVEHTLAIVIDPAIRTGRPVKTP